MSARLIPEWTRYTDHNNQFYFLHEDTGESRWMLPESEEGMFIDGDEFEPAGRHEEWLKLKEEYRLQEEQQQYHVENRNDHHAEQSNNLTNNNNNNNNNKKNVKDNNNNRKDIVGIEMLISTHGISSSTQLSNCDKCIDMFNIKQVPIKLIDGSASENKDKRNKLFKLSQTRKYPQIFIVKKTNNNNNNRNGEQKATHRSYGGNYEWLQEIIDNDDIDENMLLNYPLIETFERLFSHLRVKKMSKNDTTTHRNNRKKSSNLNKQHDHPKYSTPTSTKNFDMEERSLLLRLSSHSDSSSRHSNTPSPSSSTAVRVGTPTTMAGESIIQAKAMNIPMNHQTKDTSTLITATVRNRNINSNNLNLQNDDNANGLATPILLTQEHYSVDNVNGNVPVFNMNDVDKMYRNADSSSSSSSESSSSSSESDTSSDDDDDDNNNVKKKKKKKKKNKRKSKKKKKKNKRKSVGNMVNYLKTKLTTKKK